MPAGTWRGSTTFVPRHPTKFRAASSAGAEGDEAPPRYPGGTNRGGKRNRFLLLPASWVAGIWGKLCPGLGLRSFSTFRGSAHEESLLLKSQSARKSGPEFRTFFSVSGLIAGGRQGRLTGSCLRTRLVVGGWPLFLPETSLPRLCACAAMR